MKCSFCNDFQGAWKAMTQDESDGLHGNRNHTRMNFTMSEFESSAKSCYICEILLSGCRGVFLQHKINESEILYGNVRFYYSVWTDDDEGVDDKEIHFFMKDGRRFEIEMIRPSEEEPPQSWDLMPFADRTSPNTASEAGFEKAQEWITNCTEEVSETEGHEWCHVSEDAELPTRVIDVGLRDGTVRLVEAGGKREKYICLSHCWGEVQIIKTQTETLPERKQGIPLEQLSNTFRDAVLLTRRLGINYIWIDSLCIIQDDYRDWEIESSKMASIYTNAYLTIAATHSRNGNGGLYHDTPDFEVSGSTPLGEPYRLIFRERIDHHIDVVESHPDLSGNPTSVYYPLLTRAWVYQERILSPRILHFGRYELFWECNDGLWCECDCIAMTNGDISTPVAMIKSEFAFALERLKVPAEAQAQRRYYRARLWRTMVSCYTALKLTKSKDRLPAIAGIARRMSPKRRTRYLAGLWENSLADDLLWAVHLVSAEKKPRPRPLNAPTWSWASVEASVMYWDEISYDWGDDMIPVRMKEDRLPYEHYAKVEECDVSVAGVDEFGQVEKGFLRISGLVADGVLERDVEIFNGRDNVVHYVKFPDIRLPIRSDYLFDYEGLDKVAAGTSVSCLRLSCINSESREYLISLVLKPVSGGQGLFERIGTLVVMTETPPVDPVGTVFLSAEMRRVTVV